MASIVIRLDPEKLTNPDADLRYEIPDHPAKSPAQDGTISDSPHAVLRIPTTEGHAIVHRQGPPTFEHQLDLASCHLRQFSYARTR